MGKFITLLNDLGDEVIFTLVALNRVEVYNTREAVAHVVDCDTASAMQAAHFADGWKLKITK